jgi:alpha-D-ribose 1-methylphosphonate 5-phosphate C-P lyase
MVIGKGLNLGYLTDHAIREIVQDALDSLRLDGKRVLVLIPDTTRTMPMPYMDFSRSSFNRVFKTWITWWH